MKREFSAGGIVFNTAGQVLLTKHSQNKHWSFPKGLLDLGQTSEQAAVREVREEGGIEAEIVNKVGYSKYVYTLNGEKIFKVVTYYLMKYLRGDPKDHDWEVEEAGWYDVEAALTKLTFSQDKILLKKAKEICLTSPGVNSTACPHTLTGIASSDKR
ncbi:MAG: 7,8-dihydro-8-oxoguanine triphosphatase [Microgenomates group bacterium Gr01-1014_7]|nr:MAG: 7,8-dihydro-8-oxoguanine triphosphatase [Microgenomates group bacterium Gr01-1014_7]